MILSLNKNNKTISHHKERCREVEAFLRRAGITLEDLKNSKDGIEVGQNLWIYEEHFSKRLADIYFNGRDYGKIYCAKCF